MQNYSRNTCFKEYGHCVCMSCDHIPVQGHAWGQIMDDKDHTLEGGEVIQVDRKLCKTNKTQCGLHY